MQSKRHVNFKGHQDAGALRNEIRTVKRFYVVQSRDVIFFRKGMDLPSANSRIQRWNTELIIKRLVFFSVSSVLLLLN